MNPNDYQIDRGFADAFEPQIKEILRQNAMYIIDICASDENADRKQATDLIVKTIGGSVAVRVRRNTAFRDLTIRSYRDGRKTELHKLREGFADWYLYAWSSGNTIVEYILVNVNRMRQEGLLDSPRKETPNKDGHTRFVDFPIAELREAGCIIAEWKIKKTEPLDLWALASMKL